MNRFTLAVTATLLWGLANPGSTIADFSLNFDRGVTGWRVVVDGVMGGESTGRVASVDDGALLFTGQLSLENNGGFSQIRAAASGEDFVGEEGLQLRVRGDGRTYIFDLRASNARMMAGSYQATFDTTIGEWQTITLPFDAFKLYSFGRLVPNAPTLDPGKIESIGVTLADKKPGGFRLEIDSIRSVSNQDTSGDDSPQSLSEVAVAEGLTTLLTLVERAELELPTDEPVTIFAPTDDVFATLTPDTERLLTASEGSDELRSILLFHIAPGALSSSDVLVRRTIPTLNGQRLATSGDEQARIENAFFTATDIEFDGGVIHIIDDVMMPNAYSIVDIVTDNECFSTLATAVKAADLVEQLSIENGPWTIFAPTNSAFEALPDGALESLLDSSNIRDLVEILGLHVVPGRLYSNDLLLARTARTLMGTPIEFTVDQAFQVNGVNVVDSDIDVANGVIHVIDEVLLPPASTEAPMTREDIAQDVVVIFERAINRGVPLFNAGQPEACAAVYEVSIESVLQLGGELLDRRVKQRLEMGLAEADASHTLPDRAWALRRAMDDALRVSMEPSPLSANADHH